MDEQLAVHLNDLDHSVDDLNRRMCGVEENQKAIQELTVCVKELSVNMTYMVEEQKKQGGRLEKLEQAPAESAKKIRQSVASAIISTIVGLIVGALFALIIR